MIGRTPANIDVIRPLRDGVISNYEITEEMLSRFIEKIVEKKGFGRFVMPRIMVCVPTGVTEVEKRAVEDATKKAGAREKVQLIGFGNFEVRERAARQGRNPQTGEAISIAASKVPAFKAGKALKDAVK